jgi:hypothetical protein
MPSATSAKVVVVLGSSGFLGHHLVCDLVERGFTVRAIDLRPPSVPFPESVTFDACDVTSSSLVDLIGGAWALFHCASPPPHLNDRYEPTLPCKEKLAKYWETRLAAYKLSSHPSSLALAGNFFTR